MYKFLGNPWQEVKGLQSGLIVFRFDSKGEYYTDDQTIIDRAIGHFDHILVEATEVGERVKKTITTPQIQITTTVSADSKDADKQENNSAGIPCKHCGATFDDALALARHTKKEHKT